MRAASAMPRIVGRWAPGFRVPAGAPAPGGRGPGRWRVEGGDPGSHPWSAEGGGMEKTVGSFAVKKGLAQMLKGGVIMDVVTAEHARIAEEAGAVAVMALERVPA